MTVHNRYQITDPICGLVETATSLSKAMKIAQAHKCEGVEVFDVMARRDCEQVWDAQGKVKAYRKPETNTAA